MRLVQPSTSSTVGCWEVLAVLRFCCRSSGWLWFMCAAGAVFLDSQQRLSAGCCGHHVRLQLYMQAELHVFGILLNHCKILFVVVMARMVVLG